MNRVLFIALSISFMHCGNNLKEKVRYPSQGELIALNKQQHQNEIEYIKTYLDTLGWEMTEGNTGIFYAIKSGSSMDSILSGNYISVDYKVSTLEIPPFSGLISSGNKWVAIDNDDSETGVHQALKMMSLGDSGIFIIPSHLAYGFTGMSNQIQPNTPLMYSLKATSKSSK
jgi:hypothetical protein